LTTEDVHAQTHLDTLLSAHSALSTTLANPTDAAALRLRFQHEADTDVSQPETTRSPVEQTDDMYMHNNPVTF